MILIYRLAGLAARPGVGRRSARTSSRRRRTASTRSRRSCSPSRSARRRPGLAGVFIAAKLRLVSPNLFRFDVSFTVLAMVVLGGMGNIWGVAVGAFIIFMIQNVLLKQLNLFFDNVQVPILSDIDFLAVPVPAVRHRAGRDDAAAARGPVPEPAGGSASCTREEDRGLRTSSGDRARARHPNERPSRRRRRREARCRATLGAGGDPPRGRRASPSGSAAWSPSATSTSSSRRARSSASSGPTAPARRRSSTSSPGIIDPTPATVDVQGPALIARPRRVWLESVVWVAAGDRRRADRRGRCSGPRRIGDDRRSALAALVAIGAARRRSLLAIIRPPWYQTLLARFGIFRSARPNDMVAAGHRPDVPEHPPVPEHDGARERARRDAPAAEGQPPRRTALDTPRQRREEEARREARRELLRLVGLAGASDELAKNLPYGDQRRLEIARALAQRPVAAAARRADRRHEPARDGRADRA